jgi:ClpP class serine protease
MHQFFNSPFIGTFFSSPLLITHEEMQKFLMDNFIGNKQAVIEELPSYKEISKNLSSELSNDAVHLTVNYNETDIPEDSIAYHRIHGTVFFEPDPWRWFFSTLQFIDDLKAADNNPNINAHFISTKTGGGVAYYLDVAAEVMKNLKKPVVEHTTMRRCSAGVYLTCHADESYVSTPFDTIGSIGTMVSFWDFIPYFEELGLKHIEEYADQSDKKNKKFNDLRTGKPKQYIDEELNPLSEAFIRTVREARPETAKLKEEHPLFRGETFDGTNAVALGLADGMMLQEEALQRAIDLGSEYKEKNDSMNKAFSIL